MSKLFKKILSLIIVFSLVFSTRGFNSLKMTYADDIESTSESSVETTDPMPQSDETVESESSASENTTEGSTDVEDESESESITEPEGDPEDEATTTIGEVIESESTVESESSSEIESESNNESESCSESIYDLESTSESYVETLETIESTFDNDIVATKSFIVEEEIVSSSPKATDSEIEKSFDELDTYSQITFADADAATIIDDTIVLKKDIKLAGTLKIKDNLTIDLDGYSIEGPEDNYAIYVENNFTLNNTSENIGQIKSKNQNYPTLYLYNASINLYGGNIVGAYNGGDAIHSYNSDIVIDGAKIDGGIGEDKKDEKGGNGGDAIVIFEATSVNKIDVVSGIVRGGNGGNGIGDDFADTGSAILVLNKSYGGLYIGKANTAKTTGGGRGGNGIHVKTNDFKSENLTYEHFSIAPGSAGNTSKEKLWSPLFGVNPPPENHYSLHNLGGRSYITSLKDQRNTSLCFVFSTIAYAETNLLIHYPEYARDVLGFDIDKTYNRTAFTPTGTPDGEIDFAEMYLGQSIYSQPRDEFGNAGASSILNNGSGWYGIGGDTYMLSSFLSSWRGIVVEDDYYRWHDDYDCDRLSDNVNNATVKNKLNEYTNKTELHLKSARAYDGRDFNNNRNDINNTLKNLIKSNNGVLMGIFIGGGGTLSNYTLDDVSYGNVRVYSNNEVNTSGMGHMIYMIGWDDTVSIPASLNNGRACTGAFICKDSYDMFSLIPYDFYWCMKSSSTATEYSKFCDWAVVEWELGFSKDENNYFYDGSAGVGGLDLSSATYNTSASAGVYRIDTDAQYSSLANIYRVRNIKERINAVNVSLARDEDVRVSIYRVTDNSTDALKTMTNELAYKEVSMHRGSNIVRFDTPIDVDVDDYIAVVVHKTNGSMFTSVPCEYDITDPPFNYSITEKNSSYIGDYANSADAVKLYKQNTITGNYDLVVSPDPTEQGVIDAYKNNYKWFKYVDLNFRIKLLTNNYVELDSQTEGTFDGGLTTKFIYPTLRASMSELIYPTATQYKIFDKYTTNASGTGTQYTKNSAYHIDIASFLRLYAQYRDRARVTFATAHGTAPADKWTDDNWKITAPASPTADGYIFKYWYETDDTIPFDFANETITSNKTLTAYWRPTHIVTFDADGGSGSYGPIVAEEGTYTTPGAVFTRSQYRLDKWIDELNNEVGLNTPIEFLTDKTLKAKWVYVGGGGNPGGGSTGGGGGGGGGGGTLPNAPKAITETTIAIDTKAIVPVDTTINAAWTVDPLGKWHVNIVGIDGQVTELKNSWCSLTTNQTLDNKPIVVTDYYYIGSDGAMATGWITDVASRKYFLDTEASNIGKMVRGWKKIVNDYYYFGADGVLFVNSATPDGYLVDVNGKWLKQQ